MGFIQLKLPKKIRRKKLPNTAKRRKALAFHETWLKIRSLDLKSLKRRLKSWTGYPFPDLSTDPNWQDKKWKLMQKSFDSTVSAKSPMAPRIQPY